MPRRASAEAKRRQRASNSRYVYASRPWRTATRFGQIVALRSRKVTGDSGMWFAGFLPSAQCARFASIQFLKARWRQRVACAEHTLHQYRVEPAVELVADVDKPTGLHEAVSRVQPDRCRVIRTADDRDH